MSRYHNAHNGVFTETETLQPHEMLRRHRSLRNTQQQSASPYSSSYSTASSSSMSTPLATTKISEPPSYYYNNNYYHYDDEPKSPVDEAANIRSGSDAVEATAVPSADIPGLYEPAISPFSLPLMSSFSPSPSASSQPRNTDDENDTDYYSDLSAASANRMLKVVRYLKENKGRLTSAPPLGKYNLSHVINSDDNLSSSFSASFAYFNDSADISSSTSNISQIAAYPSRVRVTNAHLYTTATFQNHLGGANASDGELSFLHGEPTLATWLVVVLAVIMSCMCMVTIVGNLLILHSLRIEKRLHTVSNIFIGSLAIADLIVGFFVMPLSTYYILNEFRWSLGLFTCQLWLAMDYVASTASIFNLFALSLDRFWSITSPLKYLKRRTKKRALVMVSIVWAASALWTVPVVFGHYVFNGGVRLVPTGVCDTEFLNALEFKIFTAIINFYLPLIVMLCLYGKIFAEIRKQALTFQPGTKHKGGASSTSDRSRTESSSTTNIGGLGGAGGGGPDDLLSKKPRRSKSGSGVDDEGESLHHPHRPRDGSKGGSDANDASHLAQSSKRHHKRHRSKNPGDGSESGRHGSRDSQRQKTMGSSRQNNHNSRNCSLDADSSSGKQHRRGTHSTADEQSLSMSNPTTSGNTQQSTRSDAPSSQAACSGLVDNVSACSGSTSANYSLGYYENTKRASTTSSGGGTTGTTTADGSSQSRTMSCKAKAGIFKTATITNNGAVVAAARAGVIIGTYVLPSVIANSAAPTFSGLAMTKPTHKSRGNFMKSLFGKNKRSEAHDETARDGLQSSNSSNSSVTLPVIVEQPSPVSSKANITESFTVAKYSTSPPSLSQKQSTRDGFIPMIVVDAFSNDDEHSISSGSNDNEGSSISQDEEDSADSLPISTAKKAYRSYCTNHRNKSTNPATQSNYIIPCVTVINFDDEETRNIPTILVEGGFLAGNVTNATAKQTKKNGTPSGGSASIPSVHISPAGKTSTTSTVLTSIPSGLPEIIIQGEEPDQQAGTGDQNIHTSVTITTNHENRAPYHKDSLDQDDDEAFAPGATDDLNDSDSGGEMERIDQTITAPSANSAKKSKSRTPHPPLSTKSANGGVVGGGVVGSIAANMLRRLNITHHHSSAGGGGLLSVPMKAAGGKSQDDDLHSLSNFQFGEDEQARRGSNELGGGLGETTGTGNWLTTKLMMGARRFSITSIISSNPETVAWPSFGQHFPYNQQARQPPSRNGGGLLSVGSGGEVVAAAAGTEVAGDGGGGGGVGPPGLCLPPGMNTARRPSVITEFLRKQLARRKQGRSAAESNFQRQKKAAFQLGVILSAFIACWLPYFVSFLLVAVCPTCISIALHIFLTWLGYVNSGVNPFLYSYTNVNFRRAILKTISCDYYRESKQRNGSAKIRCDGQSQSAPAGNDDFANDNGRRKRPGFFMRHGRRMILVPLGNRQRDNNRSNLRSSIKQPTTVAAVV